MKNYLKPLVFTGFQMFPFQFLAYENLNSIHNSIDNDREL